MPRIIESPKSLRAFYKWMDINIPTLNKIHESNSMPVINTDVRNLTYSQIIHIANSIGMDAIDVFECITNFLTTE